MLDDKLFQKLDEERNEKHAFDIKPMYSKQSEEKKVYASSLRSDGAFDDTLERASENQFSERKSVRFNDNHRSSLPSVMNRPGGRYQNYESPFKMASKMITSDL
jgi:hypothetical protein